MNFALVLALLGGDCHVQQVVTHQAYVAQAIAAPAYAIQYPVFVYAVGDSQKVDQLTKIAEQNAQLLAQQTQLIQALNASPAAGAKASPNEAAARAILQRSCVSCHSGAAPKGGVDLSGPLSIDLKMSIAESVEDGRMPPNQDAVLPDADFQTLDKWAKEDKEARRAFLRANRKPKSNP